MFKPFNKSERQDLNLRPLPPQGSALAKLSYAPMTKIIDDFDYKRIYSGCQAPDRENYISIRLPLWYTKSVA